MKSRETSAEIDQAASAWVARIDRAPLGYQEQLELEEWLAGDERRRGAFVRARAVWLALERSQALASGGSAVGAPNMRLREVISRRSVLATAASLVVAAGVGFVGLTRRNARTTGTSFVTGPAQLRTLRLADGSTTIVNAKTALNFAFDRRRRLVNLERGESWFQVFKDPERTFIVRAAGVEARALGTAFAVNQEGKKTTVTVTEGLVEVVAARDRVQVGAGARATVGPLQTIIVEAVALDRLARELAWREGRVVVAGETVAEAASRFNRFNGLQIVVTSRSLAAEPMVGSFNLSQPDQFVEAVADAFKAKITRQPARIILEGHGD